MNYKNIFKLFIKFWSAIIFFMFIVVVNTQAAVNPFDNGANISIRMFPENPGPNKKVKVDLSSFSFDIDRSKTKVVVNGKTLANSYSAKTFEFTTPANGNEVKIEITAESPDGLIYKTTRIFLPAEVDLIYESVNAFRPPLYKGKADILNDAEIQIVAMPELYEKGGKKISPTDLVYRWRVDNQADDRNSGYGKNVYRINRVKAGPIKTVVSVFVETRDGKIAARKSVEITPKESKTYFYLQNSLEDYSLRKPIVGGKIETENDIIYIRSAEYFMSDLKNKNLVKNSWFLNGQERKTYEGVNIIKFNNARKYLKLELLKVINNSFRPLQGSRASAVVEFEKVQRNTYNQIEKIKSKSSNPIGSFFSS